MPTKIFFSGLLLMKVVKILLRENFDLTNSFPTGTVERILQILPFTSIWITNTLASAR